MAGCRWPPVPAVAFPPRVLSGYVAGADVLFWYICECCGEGVGRGCGAQAPGPHRRRRGCCVASRGTPWRTWRHWLQWRLRRGTETVPPPPVLLPLPSPAPRCSSCRHHHHHHSRRRSRHTHTVSQALPLRASGPGARPPSPPYSQPGPGLGAVSTVALRQAPVAVLQLTPASPVAAGGPQQEQQEQGNK